MGHDSVKMAMLGSVWELLGGSGEDLWLTSPQSLRTNCHNKKRLTKACFWVFGDLGDGMDCMDVMTSCDRPRHVNITVK